MKRIKVIPGFLQFAFVSNCLIILFAGFILSCAGENRSDSSHNSSQVPSQGKNSSTRTVQKISHIQSPENNAVFRIGEKIPIEVALSDSLAVIDSIQVYVDGEYTGHTSDGILLFQWSTLGSKVGKRILKTITYSGDNIRESNTISVILKSDIVPEQYSYRIIHEFPHDITAYTQGLVYEDGIIYESTGQRGESTLRKVDLESGKLLESLNLPPDLFGEGTCILGDNIIQLTWTSKVGFVYDKKSFRLQRRIEYPTQGWGITTDNRYLIMSDGSNVLYFLEPDYFTEISRIEVFDNEKAIRNLNELEFIDNKIFANVYQSDLIAVIDPGTGKVLSWIDLHGLLSPEDYQSNTDVLNGIAFDTVNKRLFVTGKRWPKIFEIQLVVKQPG